MNRTTRLPRAVLCDLDGVLRLWDDAVTADLERAYGIAPGTLASVAYDPERLTPAVTGTVSDTEWRLGVAAALVDDLGSTDRAAAFVADWSSPLGVVDEEVRDLLAAVRHRGARVVLVSNATTRLETDLSVLGLHAEVDAVVSSARVGAAKPDKDFYLRAAEAADVPAEHCLFVDDTEAYLAPARALGMAVHHYRDAEGLRDALAPVLALPAAGEPNGRAKGSVPDGGDARAAED